MLVAVLMGSIAYAHAGSTSPANKVTGVYSSMSYNKEAGDIIGVEVFVVYSRDGYRVIYQSSEGEPIAPIVVPAKIQGDSISFSVPPDVDSRGSFVGKIEAAQMIGVFSGSGEVMTLKRRPSYWQ
jgi:hypothetical protein